MQLYDENPLGLWKYINQLRKSHFSLFFNLSVRQATHRHWLGLKQINHLDTGKIKQKWLLHNVGKFLPTRHDFCL